MTKKEHKEKWDRINKFSEFCNDLKKRSQEGEIFNNLNEFSKFYNGYSYYKK